MLRAGGPGVANPMGAAVVNSGYLGEFVRTELARPCAVPTRQRGAAARAGSRC